MYKNIIKGAFVYGGINIIQKSISIFLVPLYLIQLSSNQYGQLEVSLAIYAFVSHLFMFQLEAGFQRFFYENDSNAKSRLEMDPHGQIDIEIRGYHHSLSHQGI